MTPYRPVLSNGRHHIQDCHDHRFRPIPVDMVAGTLDDPVVRVRG